MMPSLSSEHIVKREVRFAFVALALSAVFGPDLRQRIALESRGRKVLPQF